MSKPKVQFCAPPSQRVEKGDGSWETKPWDVHDLVEYETNVLHGNHEQSRRLFGPFAGMRKRSRAEKLKGKVKKGLPTTINKFTDEERELLLQQLMKEVE